MQAHELSIAQAAIEIREGRLTSVELIEACLARIAAVDGPIGAWAFLDRDHALRQAAAADDWRRHGKALGRLHGVPLGIKDIYDTGDMPTELGSPIHAGRTPRRDAVCVARLRQAGAVIMGKTVTTEFAYFHPGKTANPHDPRRTPGGSSSGSAAAVAAMMVQGAIGSQTNGSVIRPAAFCGVVGFKPTHGTIPRSGGLLLSRALDHVGAFARTIEDAALLAEIMAGFDEGDPDTRVTATPPFAAIAAAEPPLPPRFAFMKTPAWNKAEPATVQAFAELVAALGEQAGEVTAPSGLEHVFDLHGCIMQVEMAANLRPEYTRAREKLSTKLRDLLDQAQQRRAVDYRTALDQIGPVNDGFDALYDEFDAILTPSAPGPAPLGLDATGDPAFCTIWSYLGMPAITLPLLKSEDGMPIGVQLVGRRGNDARLLRTARWLVGKLSGSPRGRGSKKR